MLFQIAIYTQTKKQLTQPHLCLGNEGAQLEGNLDTEYKRKLLQTLSARYKAEDGISAGTLQLVGHAGEAVECDLVLIDQWKTEIHKRWQAPFREV